MKNATIAVCLSFGLAAAALGQQAGASNDETAPDPEVVEKIEALGGRVAQVAQNDPGVEVSFHLGRGPEGLEQAGESSEGDTEPMSLDSGLAVLQGLKGLLGIHLGGTDVTDDGLAHLAGLTSLTRLHLENTKVTDSGLAHLAGLENLSYLNLYGTAVTDSGLAHLEGLRNLENLYLWQTKVTPEGAGKLQEALPECDINLGWDEAEPEPERESEPEA